jgi:hypothetical protein
MTMTTGQSTLLTRTNLWSSELKEALQDDLNATQWVDILTEFPDGTTFNIPSVGDPQTDDYVEDTAVTYRPLDTGNWTFTISEYLSSGTYITRQNEQDAFYMSQLVSSFVPKQRRAIMEHFEAECLKRPETVLKSGTDNNAYAINGVSHRISGGDTSDTGIITVGDFAYARYALKKANVPMTNLVGIVDPSVEYTLNTLSNIADVSNNPRWEGIVADGIATGMRFVKNVYGFDIYTSNYLPTDVADTALVQRDGATTVAFDSTNGVANYFFSAASDVLPWKAAWRQEPIVDAEWNKDYQRTEFVTTARYGVELFRPENMVSIVTDLTP